MEKLKRFLSPKVQGQVRHVLSAIDSTNRTITRMESDIRDFRKPK